MNHLVFLGGVTSAAAVTVLRQTGFLASFTTVQGCAASWQDPQRLERVRVSRGESLTSFLADLC